ncbi:family 2 glycosyl transferase [Candidatus Magnetoovum chiemensis]|nr:family 2 glycosyl transferase [Candidatus Magnetoovum chiemensis]
MKNLLIVIPAFNEERNIAKVIDNIKHYMPDNDILVVNDGSTDNTAAIARAKKAMIISHTFNLGYGGALQTGFRFAVEKNYEYVVTMDGDGQHDAKCIAELFDAMNTENAHVVIGSRFINGNYKAGILKKTGVWLFSTITYLYTGIKFTDPTSGFQLLKRQAFEYLSKEDSYPLDYPDANILMLLHKNKFAVRERAVVMYERTDGKSMHRGLRPFFYVVRMLLAITMVIFRRNE